MAKLFKRKVHLAEKPATEAQARDAEIHRVNRRFTRALPQVFLSSGRYDVPAEAVKEAQKLPVPDGLYRIVGLDVIYEFKGGKWVGASKNGPHVDPKKLVEVA